MSEPQARRIAELLAARDSIEEWLISFEDSLAEKPDRKILSFGNINAIEKDDAGEGMYGWQGDLRMPIADAIDMLKRQIVWINGELRGLGVAAPS